MIIIAMQETVVVGGGVAAAELDFLGAVIGSGGVHGSARERVEVVVDGDLAALEEEAVVEMEQEFVL